MTHLKTLLSASAIAAFTATSAFAVTDNLIDQDDFVDPGVMTSEVTPNVNNAFQVVFNWDANPSNSQTETVNIGFDFDLTVDFVTGGNSALGYFIADFNGVRIEDGTSTTCAGPDGAVQCNLLFGGNGVPGSLADDLSAGEYTFGVFGPTVQNGAPGSVGFGITKISAVPLPAGGVLLLSALGGFAALRRRKKA